MYIQILEIKMRNKLFELVSLMCVNFQDQISHNQSSKVDEIMYISDPCTQKPFLQTSSQYDETHWSGQIPKVVWYVEWLKWCRPFSWGHIESSIGSQQFHVGNNEYQMCLAWDDTQQRSLNVQMLQDGCGAGGGQ